MLKFLLLVVILVNFALSIPLISVKGVAYQGTPEDPLIDTIQCTLDAAAMADISTNSIRVYYVNPWTNHDGCMNAFVDKGIYVWLDLGTFNTTILQAGYHSIPIGYCAAGIAELRPQLQNYLACSTPETSIDYFGLNSYEWCGDGYSVPIFFSETGRNVIPGGRTFTDQGAIFGPKMVDTWSGSVIYEWGKSVSYSGTPIPIRPDYNNIKNKWTEASPVGVKEAAYTPSLSAPACPLASGGWKVNGNVAIPTVAAGTIESVAHSAIYTPPPASTVPASATPTTSTATRSTPASATSATSTPRAGTTLKAPIFLSEILGVSAISFN
ncbi:Glucanosyltransferase-domain-containing protein [Bisporella sp. PMI_857]|nr:Glucanosyltransferase-domain-containing protein [Bisporella sp. PMI_857]